MSDQGSPPQEPSESPGSLKSPGEISNNVREIIVGEETGPGKPAGSNQKSEILKRLKGVDLLGEYVYFIENCWFCYCCYSRIPCKGFLDTNRPHCPL